MGTQESIVIDNNQINEHFKQYQYEKDNFNIDCNVHQNKGMNEYVYSLDVNLSETIPPEFIIIIDRSSSMGSVFNYIITKTIPEVLKALGYNNRKIHIITLESYVNYFSLSQSELSQSKLISGGSLTWLKVFLS
jgi:predicted metal-dependent peptidase